MKVLFLGGPWHNERHEVTPGRSASPARSLPTHFTVPLMADEAEETISSAAGPALAAPTVPWPRGHVTYTRRFARANGERIPVYVSPEYHGPARA
jgi:hypothetical protein